MGTKTVKTRFHIAMNIDAIDDAWRYETIASVVQNAPSSKPYAAVPSIQTLVGSLAGLGTTLKTSSGTVAVDRTKLAVDTTAETNARTNVDSALLSLKTLFESNATSEDDITASGYQKRGPLPPKTPPVPPASIDVKLPRLKRGELTVSAHEAKSAPRGRYAAQWSPDPPGPATWLTLPGTGKSRTITGASGTKVWVRFARVRGQIQSDWCTPVLVTIP